MVETSAPDPVTTSSSNSTTAPPRREAALKVVVIGAGGCGINLARNAVPENTPTVTRLFFDTSMANSRPGEQVNVVTSSGHGSGSNRKENAREIESEIAQLSKEELGDADVVIAIASLGGGSGSVIQPLLIREYIRNKVRVIGVVVADSSSTISANNTMNTLKTLTAISTNADAYLPVVLLTNDQKGGRRTTDEVANTILTDLIDLLTRSVSEVDHNDRLNWIDPSRVVNARAGIKLMHIHTDENKLDPEVVLGSDSVEMVDSTLIIQNADGHPPERLGTLTRYKKVGFNYRPDRAIAGTVTGDITSIETIISSVERMQHVDRSQRYDTLDKLATPGGGDMIL